MSQVVMLGIVHCSSLPESWIVKLAGPGFDITVKSCDTPEEAEELVKTIQGNTSTVHRVNSLQWDEVTKTIAR